MSQQNNYPTLMYFRNKTTHYHTAPTRKWQNSIKYLIIKNVNMQNMYTNIKYHKNIGVSYITTLNIWCVIKDNLKFEKVLIIFKFLSRWNDSCLVELCFGYLCLISSTLFSIDCTDWIFINISKLKIGTVIAKWKAIFKIRHDNKINIHIY